MVAQTIDLPNIRRFFIPDPGMTLIEGDLQRAESQVVAWEANDPELKAIFHSGRDIHTENAIYTFGESNDHLRDRLKRCVYAIQNGGKERRVGELLNDSAKGARFYRYWTGQFPAIQEWHRRLETEVRMTRVIKNIWGQKFHWFDRTDSVLNDAVPWITQSTIAGAINRGLLAVAAIPSVELLMQVHDSLLMQVPSDHIAELVLKVKDAMSIPIPYADPLIIPVTIATSTKSWGDVQP